MAGNAEHLDQEFVETPSSLRRHTSRMEERKVTGIDPKRSRNAHLGWLTVCYREVLEEIAKPSNGSAVEELRLRIHEQWLHTQDHRNEPESRRHLSLTPPLHVWCVECGCVSPKEFRFARCCSVALIEEDECADF